MTNQPTTAIDRADGPLADVTWVESAATPAAADPASAGDPVSDPAAESPGPRDPAAVLSQPPSGSDDADLAERLQPEPPSRWAHRITRALVVVLLVGVGMLGGVVVQRQWGVAGGSGPGGGTSGSLMPGGGFPGGDMPAGMEPPSGMQPPSGGMPGGPAGG